MKTIMLKYSNRCRGYGNAGEQPERYTDARDES